METHIMLTAHINYLVLLHRHVYCAIAWLSYNYEIKLTNQTQFWIYPEEVDHESLAIAILPLSPKFTPVKFRPTWLVHTSSLLWITTMHGLTHTQTWPAEHARLPSSANQIMLLVVVQAYSICPQALVMSLRVWSNDVSGLFHFTLEGVKQTVFDTTHQCYWATVGAATFG